MFLVTDSLNKRQEKIQVFLQEGEHAIAVLLAAADCERTLRRAILALGVTPTRELAYQLGRPRPRNENPSSTKNARANKSYRSSLDGYAAAWDVELARFSSPLLKDVVAPSDTLRKAFQLRHDLVHGDRGTTGREYARTQVERLLSATSAVHKFALANGVDLEKPLKRRLKPRTLKGNR